MNYPWVAGSFPSRKASQKIRNVLFLFENVHCSNPELFTKTFCLQSAFGRRIFQSSVLPGVDLNPEPWCLKPTASPSLFCTEGESDLEDVILLFQRFHARLCPETPSPMWHVERLSSSAMQGRAHERLSTHSATQGRRCPCPEIPGTFSHLICTFSLCSAHVVPWHPWEAAAQRHLPECHCCHPTPTSTCVEANLSWRTDSLCVPCTYHP